LLNHSNIAKKSYKEIILKKLLFLLLLIFTSAFASFRGTVINKDTLQPVKFASISDTQQSVTSDENGSFFIQSNEKTYHIKAYGYWPYTFASDTNTSILELEPIKVKALYLSFWGASNNSGTLKKILKLIDTTQANAVVVDVKNAYGSTQFWTGFKQANSYGAYKQRTNRDIKKFMQTMKKHHIYTIARIVTFKDELQASHNLDYAIKKDTNNTVWRNHDNMAWVDPFDERSHNYAISIAEEAAKVGYDEINFDYIRFPAKKGLNFSQQCTQPNRIKAIDKFLTEAKKRLQKYGVFISVDTYGNVCWAKDDNGIGQTVSSLAAHADYLCPMLYPSGFSSGSFYFKYPAKHPYAVVYRSIKTIQEKIPSNRVRPWLQYFKDYTSSRKAYKRKEIQAQIKATDDIGTNGWMLWSPSSKYNLDYLRR